MTEAKIEILSADLKDKTIGENNGLEELYDLSKIYVKVEFTFEEKKYYTFFETGKTTDYGAISSNLIYKSNRKLLKIENLADVMQKVKEKAEVNNIWEDHTDEIYKTSGFGDGTTNFFDSRSETMFVPLR